MYLLIIHELILPLKMDESGKKVYLSIAKDSTSNLTPVVWYYTSFPRAILMLSLFLTFQIPLQCGPLRLALDPTWTKSNLHFKEGNLADLHDLWFWNTLFDARYGHYVPYCFVSTVLVKTFM